MNNFATLIKVWELEKAAPITYEYLDRIHSLGVGKKTDNYFLIPLDSPTISDGTNAVIGLTMCKNALVGENKYKRNNNERYLAMMFKYN